MLCACARTTVDAAGAEWLNRLLSRPLDWNRVLASASVHGLASLLASRLDGFDGVPESVQRVLQVRLRQNTQRSVALAGELVHLVDRLQTHGIHVLPFKGPLLAATAYGHLGLREFLDLDLLVRTDDVLNAGRALRAEGYRPAINLTPGQESAYLRSRYDYPFQRDGDHIVVEIHWRIVPAYFGVRLDYAGFWERATVVRLAGRQIHTLSPEDLLVVLAVHGAKHLWRRLGWISDIAQLVTAQPSLNWDRVWARATQSRSRRMLALALALAVDLLDTPLPTGCPPQVTEDRVLSRLVDHVERGLDHPRRILWREASFHLRAHDYWMDRWRYLIRFSFVTTPDDWAVIRLPRPLFPLYYLVRFVRVMVKYGGAAARAVVHHPWLVRSRRQA